MEVIETSSVNRHSSQNTNTEASPYLRFEDSLPNDFTLLPAFQNAVITDDTNTSSAFHLPQNPLGTPQPNLVFNHNVEAATASFEDIQFGDDDVPFCPGNLNHGSNFPEPVSNVFDFLEKDPGAYSMLHSSDIFELTLISVSEESPELPEPVFLDTPPPPLWQEHFTGATTMNPVFIEDDYRHRDNTVTQDTSRRTFWVQNSTLGELIPCLEFAFPSDSVNRAIRSIL
jgi:hypothetical protein